MQRTQFRSAERMIPSFLQRAMAHGQRAEACFLAQLALVMRARAARWKMCQNTTQDQITKAFRKLCLKIHPDKHYGDQSYDQAFKWVSEAYQNLMLKFPVQHLFRFTFRFTSGVCKVQFHQVPQIERRVQVLCLSSQLHGIEINSFIPVSIKKSNDNIINGNQSSHLLSCVFSRACTRAHTFSYAELFSARCCAAVCRVLNFTARIVWFLAAFRARWRSVSDLRRVSSRFFPSPARLAPHGGKCAHWGL